MRSIVLGVLLLCISITGAAYESPIKSDSPREYQVKQGDTLWDISNRFLKNPWLWPEIWHANQQVHNPHLIFPGDLISLIDIDGRPRLTVVRRGESGRTIKLTPKVRKLPTEAAIPAIPLSAVDSFLKNSRVFSSETEIKSAPYVFAARQNRIITGAGDKIYVRGRVDSLDKNVGLYRTGERLIDPDNGEFLGVIGKDIAKAALQRIDGNVASLRLQQSTSEVRSGDLALPEEAFNQQSTFFPKAPGVPVTGKVIHILDGMDKVGQLNSVVVNVGMREGMMQGDILVIYKNVEAKDEMTGEMVKLPSERAGMVMIYRPFEKVSYGIVLTSYEDIAVGDILHNP